MAYAEPVWGRAESDNRSVNLIQTKSPANLCPNVCGMGARDAVYLLEKRGLKVKLKGRGKVTKQSYQAGREIKIGSSCELLLG
jgi:cell division protein FtsI (penicillin-binding protein 3)